MLPSLQAFPGIADRRLVKSLHTYFFSDTYYTMPKYFTVEKNGEIRGPKHTSNSLIGHYVNESVTQHKYARLAETAYFFSDREKSREILDVMEETIDYRIDNQLSSESVSVYVDALGNEVVMAFRGTVNLSDIATDLAIATGTESRTARFKSADELFEKVKACYPSDEIICTGHSLGGSLAVHVAEKYHVKSFVYNPAISPAQLIAPESGNETTIYRTAVDPVSIGATIPATREVITVWGSEDTHAHAMGNFYSNSASRNDDGTVTVKKESAADAVRKHRRHIEAMYKVYDNAQDIGRYMDGLQKSPSVATKLPAAAPVLYHAIKTNEDPEAYANTMSETLNPLPFKQVNLDPDFKMTDDNAPDTIYTIGQALRPQKRIEYDRLVHLEEDFGSEYIHPADERRREVPNMPPTRKHRSHYPPHTKVHPDVIRHAHDLVFEFQNTKPPVNGLPTMTDVAAHMGGN